MESKSTSRRSFLRAAAVTMTGAVLAACGATPTATPMPTATKVPPTNTPVPAAATKPAGAATTAPAAPTATKPAPTATPVPPTPTKAPKLSLDWAAMVMSAADPPANKDSEIQKFIEDKFNVTMNYRWLERFQATDIYATWFASNQIPDVFIYETTANAPLLIDQGVIGEVSAASIKKYAPKSFKAVNDFSTWSWLVGYYKGKNWGFPQCSVANMYPFSEGWRLDSLEKIGMTKPPETIEEVEAAFTKLVTDQKIHQYGVISRAKDAPQMMFADIFGAFGTFPNHWIERADKSGADYGATTDGAKEAMTLLASWYKKGFIHPETATSGWAQCVNTWCQGKTAKTDVGTWYRFYKGQELQACIDAAGGKTILAPAPKGPKGFHGYPGWGLAINPYRLGPQLTATNPKLAKVLEIFDGLGADKDNNYFICYGKEGRDWDRDATGVPVIRKEVDRAKLGTSLGQNIPAIPDIYWSKQVKDIDSWTKYAKDNNVPFMRDLGVFIDSSKLKAGANINLIQGKWTMNFISGAVGMDKWGDWLKERTEGGGKELDAAAMEAYKGVSTKLQEVEAMIKNA